MRWLFLAALLGASGALHAQTVVKYGGEFLAGGVGARALGMGGTFVASANDVTAAYWNVAGLDHLDHPQAAYMHAERFGGIVAHDYGAFAWPLSPRSTVGVSLFRSGVDDIANTLAAFSLDGNGQPIPNPDAITFFSAADYALFVSYARRLRENLSVGVSGKIIRRGIGDFASAWGYSLDVAAQYRVGRLAVGAVLQDAAGMVQAWSVDEGAFEGFEDVFASVGGPPVGLTEYVPPQLRLGTAYTLPLGADFGLRVGLDVDLAAEGQRAYTWNVGDVSLRPRLGGELTYRDAVALRAGIADVTASERDGTRITPALGAGLHFSPLTLDYSFGDFGGVGSELGPSHRLSLLYTLRHDRWAREKGE